MAVSKIELQDTHSFSAFFLDYVKDKPQLRGFYGGRPEPESFEGQIKKKNDFSTHKRDVLCEVLRDQYRHIKNSEIANEQIDLLCQSNTYTITTGHQLNIFTGPLYFIYKIAAVINACKTLKAKYPNDNFVPVYWMASEDHDFEEISYFNLFGKKYQWECNEKGGVGRFSTETLKPLLESLPESVGLFERAYTDHQKLSNAVRDYVHELFGKEGLLVVDADSRPLKGLFAPVIKDDIVNHTAHERVLATNAELNSLGYKTQIFPREINFFYLDDQLRERIVKEGDQYKVMNTDLVFSEAEIAELIEKSPEKFSPNVVMRPLYQETILPNLAYSGGPAEIIYWMQLGKVFEHYETPFPILLPRSFALYINSAAQKKLERFSLSTEQLFISEHEIQEQYLAKNGQDEMNLNGEVNDLKAVYDHLIEKATKVDGSLKGFIGAEHAKALKGMENIEKRLKKSEEKKHETALGQLSAIKQKLFPAGGLQERHDNFLNFYINNPDFIEEIQGYLDPFDMRMNVIYQE